MADRFHADDVAIFAAGEMPPVEMTVKYWPGQFFNVEETVTSLLVEASGLSFRLMNYDWQKTSDIDFPHLRLRFHDDGTFAPWFYLSNAEAVKRTKFVVSLSTPSSGTLLEITVAVQDYTLNDDNTITFEGQHPLVEWSGRDVSEQDAVTVESNLIPNT